MTNEEMLQIRSMMREEMASNENKFHKELSSTENRLDEKIASTENRLREEISTSENRLREEISSTENRIMDRMDERLKVTQSEIMQGAAVLLESQFMGHFNLLLEKIEDVLRKLPSDEDMDIIDGTLREHDSEIKRLRQDVNELKKAL